MRFVVLATARSGSSLLVRGLETHPDCLVHGEIFHPDYRDHLQAIVWDAIVPNGVPKDPRSYVRLVLDTNLGRRAVGFKMWQVQSPTACDYILETESIHKIILERENKFAQYSSARLADTTGVWNIHVSECESWNSTAQLASFDVDDFKNFLEDHRRVYDYYRDRARGPVYEITYSAVAKSGLATLLEFLDLPARAIEPQMKKLYGSDILGRFASDQHHVIRDTLASLGKPEWVSED